MTRVLPWESHQYCGENFFKTFGEVTVCIALGKLQTGEEWGYAMEAACLLSVLD